ncbi:MAG: pimeloyl-[acyl-carrier protein] methyl ester esterase [Gammaproteobacteria bacterium]|nr:MAG: pimeloyl-[acyl-carrier protein] methyl ester esterase [Gammaproteobacteria bacterium]RLA22420.1 MAG: pimeloyl-[acyl-carrier protein] methyl ester esterase [Gammaproteobacteria bacterium]
MAKQLFSRVMGNGPDLVMVHGWGMSSAIWLEFAEQLSKHYRVTCFDLPGHGFSTPINTFNLDAIADCLLKQAPEKASWIGWSLGAMVALKVAEKQSYRVSSLTLLAGTAKFIGSEQWPGMQPEILDSFISALLKDHHKTLLRFLVLQGKGDVLKTLRQRVAKTPEPDDKTLEEGLVILKEADLRAILENITCPLQFLMGSEDAVVPVSLGAAMQALQPSAQLDVIEGASHLPFLSHPDETQQALHNFLRSNG